MYVTCKKPIGCNKNQEILVFKYFPNKFNLYTNQMQRAIKRFRNLT